MPADPVHKKKSSRINIITLGCSKNLVDSESLMGQLKANNITVVHDQNEPSDIVIINTCGFIEDAKQESIDTILQFAGEKQNGNIKKLYIMGCLSQRYKTALQDEFPEVDGFYGVNDLEQIIKDLGNIYYPLLFPSRALTTGHYAYLKIADGCDRKCSFCAIPLIKGKHKSRGMEDIIEEAKALAENGVRELILIAQDLTYYGMDNYKTRRLGALISSLSEINELEWIRLHYAYPAGFPIEILDIMREKDNICNYIDIPFQHISNSILKSMRRGITRDETYRLIENIKKKVPGIALRTSLVVGYPGETDENFQELTNFIREIQFDRLGVFIYSHEEGTNAYKLSDDIPPEIKQARMEEIMLIQEEISYNKNREKIWKIFKVLIDRKEGRNFVGRTEFDSPEVDNEVLITMDSSGNHTGSFHNVKITHADSYDLYGIFV
jgi:ribosomal protein S12 methylthiotransferase